MTRNEYRRRENAVLAAFRDQDVDKAFENIKQIVEYNAENIVCRFRPPKEREIDMLERQKIFLVRPRVYEDSGDCEMLYNIRELYRYFMLEVKPEKYKYARGFINAELDEKIKTGLEANPRFQEMRETVRNKALVACLSENYDDYMWEKYAYNGEGICLVYDLLDVMTSKPEEMRLYPVRYVEDRKSSEDIWFGVEEYGDAPDGYKKEELKYLLSCFTKDKIPYSREAEWRLLCEEECASPTDIGREYDFRVKPSIIIMGDSISNNPGFESRVRKYAADNNILLKLASELRK